MPRIKDLIVDAFKQFSTVEQMCKCSKHYFELFGFDFFVFHFH